MKNINIVKKTKGEEVKLMKKAILLFAVVGLVFGIVTVATEAAAHEGEM